MAHVCVDFGQGSNQCCNGNCWSRHYCHMQGPWSCKKGLPARSIMHKEAARWQADNAWSDTCTWEPCAIKHPSKTTSSTTSCFKPICQSAMLHGWVCKPQDSTLGELPFNEHLRCTALPQVWRSNLSEQWVSEWVMKINSNN